MPGRLAAARLRGDAYLVLLGELGELAEPLVLPEVPPELVAPALPLPVVPLPVVLPLELRSFRHLILSALGRLSQRLLSDIVPLELVLPDVVPVPALLGSELPELVVIEPSVAWATISDEDRIEATQQQLRSVLDGEKFRDVNLKVLVGDPGHSIADYAQDVEAELIVLPSHGRTGLKRMLIGSVAERVVRLAHCPVLVLRK